MLAGDVLAAQGESGFNVPYGDLLAHPEDYYQVRGHWSCHPRAESLTCDP